MVRAFKLVDDINLRPEKEYNLVEVLIESEKSDVDKTGDEYQSMPNPTPNLTQPHANLSSAICQIKVGVDKDDDDILDKL